jgi:hypothetical protein
MDLKEHKVLRTIAERMSECVYRNSDDMLFIASYLLKGDPVEAAVSHQQNQIGVWERVGPDKYIRSVSFRDEWKYWAQKQHIIERHPGKKCILFIGESVGRGYLYDPEYNPAMVLQAILDSASEGSPTQIIDLARLDLGGEELMSVLQQSKMLRPDAAVIFVGNNWTLDYLKTSHQYRVASARLAEEGLSGFVNCLESNLEVLTERYARAIEDFADETKIPIIVIIPEFNLGDWNPTEKTISSWVLGTKATEWSALNDQAIDALGANDWIRVEELATKMLEIDGKTLPASLIFLAQCARRQGRKDDLRLLLEELRDCNIWLMDNESPRNHKIITRRLRSMADKHRIQVVDLPSVFKDWLKGEMPDRHLFLDYCHLSSEGIRVSMAIVAEKLGKLFGKRLPFAFAVRQAMAPSPEVEANAHFAAAIHNAHRGQPAELLNYHCKRAISFFPPILSAMMKYLEIQVRNAPNWLSCGDSVWGNSRALSTYINLNTSFTIAQGPLKIFDSDLVESMIEAIESAGKLEVRRKVDDIKRNTYGLRLGEVVDLLDSGQLISLTHPDWRRWAINQEGKRYYCAYAKVSRFTLVLIEAHGLKLDLTARCSDVSTETSCDLLINGRKVQQVTLFRTWSTTQLQVPSTLLCIGVNAIHLKWNDSPILIDSLYASTVTQLENGIAPNLMLVRAEIFSFKARRADNALGSLAEN